MADDNENKPTQTPDAERQAAPDPAAARPAPEKSAAAAEAGRTAGATEAAAGKTTETSGRAPDSGARAAGAEKTTTAGADTGREAGRAREARAPAGKAAEDSKAFDLLDKALKATDWEWKLKTGDDRNLGMLTYVNAQNAWVEAAIEDPKRASAVWLNKSRRNPTAEMEQNLAGRMKSIAETGRKPEGQTDGLEKVTSDIGELSKRRGLSENKTRKTALNSSLGEWHIMRGDSQQRAEQAKRSRSNELWSPEPDKNQDGMHLIKSFFKGFATHREAAQKKVANHKAKMAGKVIGDIRTELGKVTTEIKKFETELDVPMDERDTTGVVGRSRKAVANNKAFRLGKGTATIVAKVSRKVAEKGAEVAKGVAIQGAAITANPGALDGNAGSASYQSRMAAFHQFQQGRGGAGPS